jgi:hypothetical protein
MSNIQQTFSQLDPISSVIDNLIFACDYGLNGDTQRATHLQLKNDTIQANSSQSILTGSGPPSSTPSFIGQIYIDTTGKRQYIAIGTSGASDWMKISRHEYGVVNIVGGGGDVTVNLGWDWTDGILIEHVSFVSTDYYSAINTLLFMSTYDSLTNASYSGTNLHAHTPILGSEHVAAPKSTNAAGVPKSATSTSFTLDDDGTSAYIKYTVIA